MLVTFPLRDTFAGGLLFSLFNAATIGGLADSFAVGALFGNPLKIKWPAFMGTRVIERNRTRLIGELGHMVQHELLTPANIEARLNEYSISAILLRYLKEHGGEEHLLSVANRLTDELLLRLDPGEVAGALRELLEGSTPAFPLSDTAADIADWTLAHGYDEVILDLLLRELLRMADTERFRQVLEGLIASVLSAYEAGQFRRQFVNIAAGLDPESLGEKIQLKIASFLTELGSKDHPLRIQFKEQIRQFAGRLRNDPILRASLEQKKSGLAARLLDEIRLGDWAHKAIDSLLTAAQTENGTAREAVPAVHVWITRKLRVALRRLGRNQALLEELDRDLKRVLLSWTNQQHSFIAKVVMEKLDTYSTAELTAMVQEKAGRDLQYIRLNGTAVGGLIGALLYLLTFWIGG